MNKKIILISGILAVLVAAIIAFFVISSKNTETPEDVSTPVTSEEDDGNWTSIYDATLVE